MSLYLLTASSPIVFGRHDSEVHRPWSNRVPGLVGSWSRHLEVCLIWHPTFASGIRLCVDRAWIRIIPATRVWWKKTRKKEREKAPGAYIRSPVQECNFLSGREQSCRYSWITVKILREFHDIMAQVQTRVCKMLRNDHVNSKKGAYTFHGCRWQSCRRPWKPQGKSTPRMNPIPPWTLWHSWCRLYEVSDPCRFFEPMRH